ncbi:hypothetical protein CcrColossus_gp385 [Caulobacter phage CcrColossus]|uniref:Uncharacterized protein n=1 Tax=Caulobacter phage CcrColossus TaxID=1211640 RepID=K4JV63_9CAUD|nr:hypothetical protein CcrColossus_gp385 [Caulobacter phage CcrColossus]AFU88255.1 hypothetical protein CcrColossus_gp385 [Caulobacter phage CcrColossus]
MTTTPKTLSRALAYLAITGAQRGLHTNTRIAMYGYYSLVPTEVQIGDHILTLHKDKLNEAGWKLARESKLWRAHEKLVEMGFEYKERRGRQKPNFLSYEHPTQMAHKRARGAFISTDSLYVQPAEDAVPEGKQPWDYLPTEF